jgi:predicted CxxxxCH...CXXCH cytochrome family protein
LVQVRRTNTDETCGGPNSACHNLKVHNSTNTGSSKWNGSWGISGGKYGQFQCKTCHILHNTKNIYLIRETITTPDGSNWESSGTSEVNVDFRYKSGTPGSSSYAMGDDTGGHSTSTKICEVCHTQNKYHNYDTANNTGGLDHNNAKECSECHLHSEGFKPSCDACHNSPPTTGKHFLHFGNGSAGYGDTVIQSTQSEYRFSCGICHSGTHKNTGDQSNNPHTVEVIFAGIAIQDPKTGSSTYTPATNSVDDPGTGWTFNYSDGTCSDIYCHGNYPGSGNNAFPKFETGSAPCGSCHNASNTTVPASGTHSEHALSSRFNFPCTLCHKDIAGGNGPDSYTIVDKSKHVNGYVDWKFDTGDPRLSTSSVYSIPSGTEMPSDGSTPRAYGYCNNIYCHSNVQPDGGVGGPTSYGNPIWGTYTVCQGCHKESTHAVHGGQPIDTGSHTKHLSYSFNAGNTTKCTICHKWNSSAPFNDCSQCHTAEYQKHANYQVDVIFDPYFGSNATYNGTPEPGDGYSNCSNTYCHSNGTSVSTGTIPANTSPDWGSGSLACDSCHGYPPGYTNGSPKANSHLEHSGYTCNYCHVNTTSDGSSISSTSYHVNKAYNADAGAGVSFSYTFDTAGGTCSNISCHTSPHSQGDIKWGETSCKNCHL